MLLQRCLFFLFLLLQFIFSAPLVSAGSIARMEKLPSGEHWFGIYFNGDRVGFSYLRVREDKSGYEFYGESVVKMNSFAFSRDATFRETYRTNSDLSLRSFSVHQIIDGTPMTLRGEASPSGIRVLVEAKGTKKEKLLKHRGALYPPMAMNIIPLIRGFEPGRVYRISILESEDVKIKKIEISAVAAETSGTSGTIHLRNNQFLVDTDTWVAADGTPLKESVRDGLVETLEEEEKSIRKFISESALARKDFITDFSLIRTEKPVSGVTGLKGLTVELSGVPDDAELPENSVQKTERREGGKALFTIDNSLLSASSPAPAGNPVALDDYLRPAQGIPSDKPETIARKAAIVGTEKSPAKVMEKLVLWVASQAKNAVSDGSSPVGTGPIGEVGSLAHARLYASLARAAGIPTKLVSGLVYVPDKGFLYHSWAESYVGKWIPVDPLFGEIPANATHLKLVEGDSEEAMVKLSKFIGNIQAKVLDQKY